MPKKSLDHNLRPNTDYMIVPVVVAIKKPAGAQPHDMAVTKVLGMMRKHLADNDIADFMITTNRVEENKTSFNPSQGELFW